MTLFKRADLRGTILRVGDCLRSTPESRYFATLIEPGNYPASGSINLYFGDQTLPGSLLLLLEELRPLDLRWKGAEVRDVRVRGYYKVVDGRLDSETVFVQHLQLI